jgi:uncharacterized protein (UPF0548 family)
MFSLREPTPAEIDRFVAQQSRCDFSYAAVGATSQHAPPGYASDRARVLLGRGPGAFSAACAALRRWDQFDVGWVRACDPTVPIEAGRTVAVLARAFSLWSLNACRIIRVIEESGPVTRYGFAYGTLPKHIEFGEEQFLIEWDQTDGAVYYDVFAFYRPRHPLIRASWPVMRRLVNRFRTDSARRMQQAAPAAPRS